MLPRAMTDFLGSSSMGQAVFGNRILSFSNEHIRCAGKALLGTVSAATAENAVVFSSDISPSMFVNSWIQQQSKLWETYWFNNLMLFFVPVQTATVNANFAGYIDTDPRDKTVTGDNALVMSQTLLGNARSTMFTASGGALVLPKTDFKTLYIGSAPGGESRLISQGRATVVQSTPFVGFSGSALEGDARLTTPALLS